MDRRRQLYQLLDHELRVQAGSSLASWCAVRGVDPSELLGGALENDDHELIAELAEAVGVSAGVLTSMAA